MATFYIQLENKLLQISGELTAENISKALGYVPVSPSVTEELSQKIDSVSFDSLKDNPFLTDGNGELNIVDENGNTIAKIDAEGLQSIDFIAGTHKLTEKIDSSALNGYAKESWVSAEIAKAATNGTIDLTGYATQEWVEEKNYLTEHQDISDLATKQELTDLDFYTIKNNPITDDESGYLTLADESGNIGFRLSSNGLMVKDIITPEHTLSNKADKSEIPSLVGYATEDWVEEKKFATNDDLKNIDYNFINNIPLIEDFIGDFNVVDDNGNVGFKISNIGAHAKDFISSTGSLSSALSRISQLEAHVADLLSRIKALEGN